MGITTKTTGRLPGPVFIDDKARKSLALTSTTIIRTRTFTRGVGIDGKALPKYSPAYAKRRKAKGRRVSPPDYTQTGRTRRSLRGKSTRFGPRVRIEIGVVGQRSIVASVLNRRGAGWLGMSTADRVLFRKVLSKLIQQTRARQGGAV